VKLTIKDVTFTVEHDGNLWVCWFELAGVKDCANGATPVTAMIFAEIAVRKLLTR
jgi:hypothetical protein